MTEDNKNDVCHESVYERLFRDLAPNLRSFLIFKFRNVERAEDMVQEAFYIMWQNCKKVSQELAKAYLYRVAQNQFIKLLDKDKVRSKYISLQDDQLDDQDPSFELEYQEMRSNLLEAIDQLPEGQREVFLMNRMDKLTYVEIAEVLGVSVKAVEKRMHKALVKLRKLCKNI